MKRRTHAAQHRERPLRVKTGLFLAILFSAACAKSQNAPAAQQAQGSVAQAPATKMEAFRPSAGSVFTLGYDALGKIGLKISVDVRELRDAKGASARGLLVEVAESQYRDETSFVDADEIPELLKGLDALLAINENPTKFKSFEVRYTTRGQLELTAFNTNAGAIRYSVKAGRPIGATAFISTADMQSLRGLFDMASQKLASLNAK